MRPERSLVIYRSTPYVDNPSPECKMPRRMSSVVPGPACRGLWEGNLVRNWHHEPIPGQLCHHGPTMHHHHSWTPQNLGIDRSGDLELGLGMDGEGGRKGQGIEGDRTSQALPQFILDWRSTVLAPGETRIGTKGRLSSSCAASRRRVKIMGQGDDS